VDELQSGGSSSLSSGDVYRDREPSRIIARLCVSKHGERWPIRYFAIGSKRPGIFSLGGDLAAFAVAVRNGEHEVLRAHANVCVDIMHSLDVGFDLPIVTLRP